MPAVSRPLLIVLVASVLAAVAFYATRGSTPPPPSTASAADSAPAPVTPTKADPSPGTVKPLKTPAKAQSNATPAKPKPSTPAKPKPKAADHGIPAKLKQALDRHRVVVVLFRQRFGADDSATAAAVKGVRGMKGVSVFTDSIRRLSRYPRFIGALGINQAPSVVVVDKTGKARLVEGYIDPKSLTQLVVDAR